MLSHYTYSLRYSSRFSSLSEALPSVALRCSSGVGLEGEQNEREEIFTLYPVCLLAHYPQISMVRRDLLLFLLNILGNLLLEFGGIGFLASRVGDLGFRGDELWFLLQTREQIAKVGPQ